MAQVLCDKIELGTPTGLVKLTAGEVALSPNPNPNPNPIPNPNLSQATT